MTHSVCEIWQRWRRWRTRNFSDGEVLIVEEGFTYGNTSIDAGDTVATLVSEMPLQSVLQSIGEGVFFIRGTFVDVATQKIVLTYTILLRIVWFNYT